MGITEDNLTEEFLRKAKMVYNRLEDEESKKIFMYRLNWSITDNIDSFIQYLMNNDYHEFIQKVENLARENEIIIYGAGENCSRVLQICKNIHISCICDKNTEKQITGYCGIPVISPAELINHTDAVVIISTTKYQNEVLEQLEKIFSKDKLLPFVFCEQERYRKQYFDDNILNFSENEVFVDGGCYDFGTSAELIKRCKVKKIYAFEPDEENIKKIEQQIKKYSGYEIVLIKKGLWNKADMLKFVTTGDMESCVVKENKVTEKNQNITRVEVVAMDEVIKEPVSFIKMDIEGSELRALQGARHLIQNYRPKLAICIYHKPEDMIDIPFYIAKLVPEYKFYIRQYSYGYCETVLYAV